jgi:hypothetical protein
MTYLLQAPADQDLCGSLAVLLDQGLKKWIIHLFGLHQWTIRLDNDIPLLEPVDNIGTSEPWMELVLPYINLASECLVILFQFVEVVHTIVRNPNGTDFSLLLSFDESAP